MLKFFELFPDKKIASRLSEFLTWGHIIELIETAKKRLHDLCDELNLLETGCSDYHGFEAHDAFNPVQIPDNLVLEFLSCINLKKKPE